MLRYVKGIACNRKCSKLQSQDSPRCMLMRLRLQPGITVSLFSFICLGYQYHYTYARNHILNKTLTAGLKYNFKGSTVLVSIILHIVLCAYYVRSLKMCEWNVVYLLKMLKIIKNLSVPAYPLVQPIVYFKIAFRTYNWNEYSIDVNS